MPSLEQEFTQAMFDIYRRAKVEAGYNASIFFQMISDRGGVRTAKALINAPRPSEGYTHLYERGHLEITVEAVVVENPNGTSYSRRRRLPVLVSGSAALGRTSTLQAGRESADGPAMGA
jgi:hypothetical protein